MGQLDDFRHFTFSTWFEICEGLGVKIIKPAYALYPIIDSYREPERRYHNLAYIDDCLRLWRLHREDFGDDWYYAGFALILHRVAWTPGREDNIERSATRAKEVWNLLRLDSTMSCIPELMVRDTGHISGRMVSRPGSELVADITIAVTFAGDWKNFLERARNLRREQRNLPGSVFWSAGERLVRQLLTRVTYPTRRDLRRDIFWSQAFRMNYGDCTRANLERALTTLVAHRVVSSPRV